MDDEIRYLGDLQKLDLKPGDILVLRTKQHLSADASNRLRMWLEQVVPDHKVIILENDLEIGVLSKTE